MVDVPQLELTVSRSADETVRAEKLDIRDGLLVASEDVQGLLGLPEVVVVNAVVGGPEGEVVAARRVELDAADVGLRLQGGNGVSHVGLPLHSRILLITIRAPFNGAGGGNFITIRQANFFNTNHYCIQNPNRNLSTRETGIW